MTKMDKDQENLAKARHRAWKYVPSIGYPYNKKKDLVDNDVMLQQIFNVGNLEGQNKFSKGKKKRIQSDPKMVIRAIPPGVQILIKK